MSSRLSDNARPEVVLRDRSHIGPVRLVVDTKWKLPGGRLFEALVKDRLFALNAERAAAERRASSDDDGSDAAPPAAAPTSRRARGGRRRDASAQTSLLDEES